MPDLEKNNNNLDPEGGPAALKANAEPLPRTMLDIFKQMDDAFMFGFEKAFKGIIPVSINALIGCILSGGIGFLVSGAEGYEGFKKAFEAYHSSNIGQRKTRIVTGSLAVGAGATGAGVSVAYLAGYLGATVASLSSMPLILSIMLTTIYSAKLEANTYILMQAQMEEKRALKVYQRALEDYYYWERELTRVTQELISELNEHGVKLSSILLNEEKSKDRDVNDKSSLSIASKTQAIKEINEHALEDETKQKCIKIVSNYYNKMDTYLLQDFAEASDLVKQTWTSYKETKDKKLEAEREVAYSTFEVAASLLIFASTLLGTAAFLGATGAASFGIIPTVLLIAGIFLGTSTKIFEKIDERKDYHLSGKIRNWFVGCKNRLFSLPESVKEVTPVSRDSLITQAIEQAKAKTVLVFDAKNSDHPSEMVSQKGLEGIFENDTPILSGSGQKVEGNTTKNYEGEDEIAPDKPTIMPIQNDSKKKSQDSEEGKSIAAKNYSNSQSIFCGDTWASNASEVKEASRANTTTKVY